MVRCTARLARAIIVPCWSRANGAPGAETNRADARHSAAAARRTESHLSHLNPGESRQEILNLVPLARVTQAATEAKKGAPPALGGAPLTCRRGRLPDTCYTVDTV